MKIFCIILFLTSLQTELHLNFPGINIFNRFNPSNNFLTFDNNIEVELSNVADCKKRLSDLLKFNFEDSLFSPFLKYTGKRINDFGNYDLCIQNRNMSYFLFEYYTSISNTPFKVGICVPNICTNETLYQVLSDTFHSLHILKPGEIFPAYIHNTQSYNEIANQKSFGFYLSLILICFYLGLVIFSTMRTYLILIRSHKNQKNDDSTKFDQIIKCFCLKTNIEGVVKTENKIDFHFWRCLGMLWVVVSHIFEAATYTNTLNYFSTVKEIVLDTFMAILRNGTVSVDIFFTLSGFLSSMAFITLFSKSENITLKNVLLSYLHRYIRLFPIMFILWLIASYFMPTLSHGIDTTMVYSNALVCRSKFVTSFLFIDNLIYKNFNYCNSWLWYLDIDMQLFLITPLISLLFIKKSIFGLLSILILSFMSLIYQAILFHFNNISESVLSSNMFFTDIYYVNPFTRCNPYFVGIFFSFLYFNLKQSEKYSSSLLKFINYSFTLRIFRYFIYILGIFLMGFVVFAQNYFDHSTVPIPQYINSLFLMFNRSLFVFGMMFVTYPGFLGYLRIASPLLGCPFFHVIGKINYATYMMNLLLIFFLYSISLNGITFEFYHRLLLGIQIYFATYIFSFFITPCFEYPLSNLLKFALSPSINKESNSIINNAKYLKQIIPKEEA